MPRKTTASKSLPARTTALGAAWIMLGASLGAADRPVVLGLESEGFTQRERAPLQAYLTKAMGRPVRLVVADHYDEVVACLAKGSCDFAYLGALTYVRAHAQYGVIPLVQRTADLQFHSVYITGSASSIYSLRDLKGKQFAFGDINSTNGHLIPYRELLEAGIVPDTDLAIRYSGSHPATAALVENGVVDAGALDETVLNTLIRVWKIDSRKIRIFHISKPFVGNVYVARKDVPEAERKQFAHALLSLKKGKDDTVLQLLLATQFVAAGDEEYATTRQICKELKMF
jgi:phosphonate transport system substrate-binding protein